MIAAPFTAAQASAALVPLAALFIGLGGVLVIVRAKARFVRRSILLGLTLALFAGLAGAVLR